ncbi:MAG TPA: hypothetical protein VFJ16_14420 [Longimicrobium sp.]|nr:hypothetical protein [Longimicrobium sp.]
MIFGLRPQEFAAIMALFFAGTIVLVPVLAISARLALKPLTETLLKLRQNGDESTLQDRRIALLEAQVQHLSATIDQFAEDEFHRQIGAGSAVAIEHRA